VRGCSDVPVCKAFKDLFLVIKGPSVPRYAGVAVLQFCRKSVVFSQFAVLN